MSRYHVYVAAPLGVQTGGPEALHQLVDALRTMGVNAAIWPIGRTRFAVPTRDYQLYDAPIARDCPSGRRVVTVVPETSPRELLVTGRSHAWLWWLSVNNSPHLLAQRAVATEGSGVAAAPGIGLGSHARSRIQSRLTSMMAERGAQHAGFLFQSHYAEGFSKGSFGRGGHMVTDYVRPTSYPEWEAPVLPAVAYNPAKSEDTVARIRPRFPSVRFRPVSGLSYDGVNQALSSSSAYLEAGTLPGRDRLPREAARMGCPVVMLQRGAGCFESDFPLPPEYRIPYDLDWAPSLSRVLRRVLDHPVVAANAQLGFQRWVRGDKERFFEEVASWWSLSDAGRLR